MGCRSSVAAVEPGKEAERRRPKKRQPDKGFPEPAVPTEIAVCPSEVSTDDASSSMPASTEFVDISESIEAPSLSQESSTDVTAVPPCSLRNFFNAETPSLSSDSRNEVQLRVSHCSSSEEMSKDKHSALAVLGANLHTSLSGRSLDNIEEALTPRSEECPHAPKEEAATFALGLPTPARSHRVAVLTKQPGRKVSFSECGPEIRYIECLQDRRQELRCWEIAEFIELRREAMLAAGIALDGDIQAEINVDDMVDSLPTAPAWVGKTAYQRHLLGAGGLPAFSLWCCSMTPEEYSPLNDELEYEVCGTETEALPISCDKQPYSPRPREAPRKEFHSPIRNVCV